MEEENVDVVNEREETKERGETLSCFISLKFNFYPNLDFEILCNF